MSELLSVFEFAAAQVRVMSKEQSVADAPIVLGDVTVVPFSKVSCGFACGGSDLSAKKKPDALLAGAGAKVSKTPLTFLAIHNGEVQLLNVAEEDAKNKGIVGAILPLIEAWKEKSAAKKAEEAAAQ